MSVLLRSYRALPHSSIAFQATRPFGSSAVRALKESDSHAPDYEKHKQDSITKSKEGKGHWKPELASDSEEAITADRNGHDSSEQGIKELQNKTKEHAEKKHKAGTSQDPGL